ncbi:MAG: hypothetical protein ABWY66_15940, partial [Xanthobacteraceae bacterium]
FDLFEPEKRAISQLLDEMRIGILDKDASVSGFNIGMNSGATAGQTIDHAHVFDPPSPRRCARTERRS